MAKQCGIPFEGGGKRGESLSVFKEVSGQNSCLLTYTTHAALVKVKEYDALLIYKRILNE